MPMAHHHSYSNQSFFDKKPRLGHWTLCILFQTIHWIRSKPWSTFTCTACALCSVLSAGLTSLLCPHLDFIFFPLPGLWDHRVYNTELFCSWPKPAAQKAALGRSVFRLYWLSYNLCRKGKHFVWWMHLKPSWKALMVSGFKHCREKLEQCYPSLFTGEQSLQLRAQMMNPPHQEAGGIKQVLRQWERQRTAESSLNLSPPALKVLLQDKFLLLLPLYASLTFSFSFPQSWLLFYPRMPPFTPTREQIYCKFLKTGDLHWGLSAQPWLSWPRPHPSVTFSACSPAAGIPSQSHHSHLPCSKCQSIALDPPKYPSKSSKEESIWNLSEILPLKNQQWTNPN